MVPHAGLQVDLRVGGASGARGTTAAAERTDKSSISESFMPAPS